MEGKLGCAIVGYGPVFNWGWMHTRWMQAVPELEVIALCDRDPGCAAKAKRDFPETTVYTDLGELLRRDDIDLVTVVTPHNTHAAIVAQCLNAGKHTCVEKPMCLSIAKATQMIEATERAGKSLSVFHNCRHDGNGGRSRKWWAAGNSARCSTLRSRPGATTAAPTAAAPTSRGAHARRSPAAPCTTGAPTPSTGCCRWCPAA